MKLRLALREEGHMWNAYAAQLDTMDHAIWLGSIRMKFVLHNQRRKRTFLNLMKEALADSLEETLGTRPTGWTEGPAPEHERSKE